MFLDFEKPGGKADLNLAVLLRRGVPGMVPVAVVLPGRSCGEGEGGGGGMGWDGGRGKEVIIQILNAHTYVLPSEAGVKP